MGDKEDATRLTIECKENGPYIVKGLESFTNSKGETISAKKVIALCRCGASENKPFCDGTHGKVGFNDQKEPGRRPDVRDSYAGQKIIIHDNRGVCSNAGHCTKNLESVFKMKTDPWIDPDGADVEKIIETIKQCPSGALSYTVEGVEHRDQDRELTITVTKDGPYSITGGIEFVDQAWGEEASTEHYTLCRCGASRNKPFCDGSHWYIKFKDEKN